MAMSMDNVKSQEPIYPKTDLPPPYDNEMEPNALPFAPDANPRAPPVQYVPIMAPPQPVINNIVMTSEGLGPGIVCPACHARVKVTVKKHPTCKTYCLAGFLCLFLCWPCVCLPCCCDCCYRNTQYCPNCNIILGSVSY